MPPKAEITYLRPALDDMEEIVKFHINEVGPASARKIYSDMRHTLGLLADFPLIARRILTLSSLRQVSASWF